LAAPRQRITANADRASHPSGMRMKSMEILGMFEVARAGPAMTRM
jgi:hypothetical protein